MHDYLSNDIGLGIQGVAIRSGAAKKLKDDQDMYMDVMNRSMPPGVRTVVKTRLEMPSGFKIGDTRHHDTNAWQQAGGHQQASAVRQSNITNSLSRDEIFARMGIDASKELEIDWE